MLVESPSANVFDRTGELKKRSKSTKATSSEPRRSILWRVRRLLFLLGLLGIASAAGLIWLLYQVPLPPAEPLVETSYICAAGVTECGPETAMAALSGAENRIYVPLDAISPNVIDAILAQEDRNFFSHSGVDPISIGRALWTDLRHKKVAQGGSTITQQYVKNVYLNDDRTLMRKLREAALAVKLERSLSKEEILERYLNTIYFGRGAYGVEAAARTYFGKPAAELNLSEAAFFAGLIRAPETGEPTRFPEEADRRRHNALVRLLSDGVITDAQMAEAEAQTTAAMVLPREAREGMGKVQGAEFGSEYFVDAVRQFLIEEFGAAATYGGGLRVYTTLDLSLQQAAYEVITSTLDPNNPDDPAAALVSLDENNNVLAMVGGTDFSTSQVNLALGQRGGGSGRGPGSAYKPFALARALMDGEELSSVYEAPSKAVFEGANNGSDWEVTGGGSPSGEWSLLDAMRVSSNTVYAQLILDLGPARVNELARKAGVSARLPDVPSVVLGAGEVSVLDMASAYTTFRDRGAHGDPIMIERVTDASGRVLWEPYRRREQVIPAEVADEVTYSLASVVTGGTGRSAAVAGQVVAGKTGTTTNNRDAWFVGYSCQVSTAIWMGYPGADSEGRPRRMNNFRGISVTGGSFPAQMWGAFMQRALEGRERCEFPQITLTAPTTTPTVLRCPVDGTDTTDPSTPIELCPPVTEETTSTTSDETDSPGTSSTTSSTVVEPPPSSTTTSTPTTTSTTSTTQVPPDENDEP